MNIAETLKQMRKDMNLSRKDFSDKIGIPLRTIEDWEAGRRKPPEYIPRLIAYWVKLNCFHSNNIEVVKDVDGKNIVLVNDIRFKSRRGIDWKEVERCLKEYIGQFFEIAETSEKIYIGTDFPDEFSHSNDTVKTKGANAKANLTSAIGELVQIASEKTEYPDYDNKHGEKAKRGWYRYNTRFGIPVYDENGELERYNIFSARMLVRCDVDDKLYLYDFVRTKKETSDPLEH